MYNFKNKIYILLVTNLLLVSFISCDRPKCSNTNPIFDNFSPNDKVYKDELVKQLKLVDIEELRFWLEKYEEKNGQEYLYFYIQGDHLCAKIVLTMKQWKKLEDVREKKAVSYRGAEFTGLKFDIQQDSLITEFIYRDFGRIID